jgi:hypothetical protein
MRTTFAAREFTGEPLPDSTLYLPCEREMCCRRFVLRRCGAYLSPQRGDWAKSLRIRAHAAAPGEHVLRLSVVSSLFPRLPSRCVSAFRLGLAALLAVLVVCALLRWQPPLIALSTVGLPLVFLTYLRLSDVYYDLPVRTLVVTALLAIALGIRLGIAHRPRHRALLRCDAAFRDGGWTSAVGAAGDPVRGARFSCSCRWCW